MRAYRDTYLAEEEGQKRYVGDVYINIIKKIIVTLFYLYIYRGRDLTGQIDRSVFDARILIVECRVCDHENHLLR